MIPAWIAAINTEWILPIPVNVIPPVSNIKTAAVTTELFVQVNIFDGSKSYLMLTFVLLFSKT